jgi:hypothetical protein
MSVFQELATAGEAVAGLPTLLVWCCRCAVVLPAAWIELGGASARRAVLLLCRSRAARRTSASTDAQSLSHTPNTPVRAHARECRKADEFEFLGPRLLAMAAALKLDITLRLYCTGVCDRKRERENMLCVCERE